MFLDWIGSGLIVFFISMIPIIESRGAVIYGIVVLKMTFLSAMIWGLLGNFIILFILLKILDPITKWIFKHSSFLERHIKKYFDKLHTKHSIKFNDLGAVFLAIFVGVPIPGTGSWTGVLLAYIFNIPFRLAFGAISIGIVAAALIAAILSESAIHIFT